MKIMNYAFLSLVVFLFALHGCDAGTSPKQDSPPSDDTLLCVSPKCYPDKQPGQTLTPEGR